MLRPLTPAAAAPWPAAALPPAPGTRGGARPAASLPQCNGAWQHNGSPVPSLQCHATHTAEPLDGINHGQRTVCLPEQGAQPAAGMLPAEPPRLPAAVMAEVVPCNQAVLSPEACRGLITSKSRRGLPGAHAFSHRLCERAARALVGRRSLLVGLS